MANSVTLDCLEELCMLTPSYASFWIQASSSFLHVYMLMCATGIPLYYVASWGGANRSFLALLCVNKTKHSITFVSVRDWCFKGIRYEIDKIVMLEISSKTDIKSIYMCVCRNLK